MVGVRNAELMDASVEPLDHFYFTDEVNEVPGIGNLASRYTRKKQEAATRLMAPVIKEENKGAREAREAIKMYEVDKTVVGQYVLIGVVLVLLLSRQYAALSALLAGAWVLYAVA